MNRKNDKRSMAKGGPKDQTHVRGREVTPALIAALDHPVRREILRLLGQQDTPISPVEMTESIDLKLSRLAYHARVLAKRRVTRLTHTRSVRGSTQHFYVSTVANNKLVDVILKGTEKDDSFLRMRPERKKKASSG